MTTLSDGAAPATNAAPWLPTYQAPDPAEFPLTRLTAGEPTGAGKNPTEPLGGFVWVHASRPAYLDVTYGIRPWDKWAAEHYSGINAVVIDPLDEYHFAEGGMSALHDHRTTARGAPVLPWDAGALLGEPDPRLGV